MQERGKFIEEWTVRWHAAEGGPVNMTELARMFGVSRQTAYVWVERYKQAGFDEGALVERSRRPLTSPTKLSLEVEDVIVATRRAHPKWGPRKLRVILVEQNPGVPVPSASAIAKILKRRTQTKPRKRSRRAPAAGVPSPFVGCDAPNDVWCIDFKGWFVTDDGVKCYPLTLIDAFSRFLIRCEALVEPDGRQVRRILDSAFQEYGLPRTIRSDGGPPFASTGPAKLTDLSVWLLQLGIRIEITAPSSPQQNGRLERFHRTLKAETASPPAEDAAAQQRRFDVWRGEYNDERPHEALGMRRPGQIYYSSSRHYPRPLIKVRPEPWTQHIARLDRRGFIRWQRHKVFISSALRYERVSIEPDEKGRWQVSWGQIRLGHLVEHAPGRGLVYPRRQRGKKKVSGMSLG